MTRRSTRGRFSPTSSTQEQTLLCFFDASDPDLAPTTSGAGAELAFLSNSKNFGVHLVVQTDV